MAAVGLVQTSSVLGFSFLKIKEKKSQPLVKVSIFSHSLSPKPVTFSIRE
jgi:hypothetical protein